MYDDGATVAFVGDTLVGDVARSSGGGVYNGRGAATLENDTLTQDVGGLGGGLYNDGGIVALTQVTLWNDRTTYDGRGGAFDNGDPVLGTIQVGGSIMAEPSSYPSDACRGVITAPRGGRGAYNVVTDASCSTGVRDVTSTGAAIDLQPLDINEYGGPRTMAILPTSSAFEVVAVGSGSCLPVDERQRIRPGYSEHNCDAGAFEAQEPFAARGTR